MRAYTLTHTRMHALIHTLPHYKATIEGDIMSKVLSHLQIIHQTMPTQAYRCSCLHPQKAEEFKDITQFLKIDILLVYVITTLLPT